MDMGGATPCGMIQTAAALSHAGICRAVLCNFGAQANPQGILPTLFGSQLAVPYGDVGAMPFMEQVAHRQTHVDHPSSTSRSSRRSGVTP